MAEVSLGLDELVTSESAGDLGADAVPALDGGGEAIQQRFWKLSSWAARSLMVEGVDNRSGTRYILVSNAEPGESGRGTTAAPVAATNSRTACRTPGVWLVL